MTEINIINFRKREAGVFGIGDFLEFGMGILYGIYFEGFS